MSQQNDTRAQAAAGRAGHPTQGSNQAGSTPQTPVEGESAERASGSAGVGDCGCPDLAPRQSSPLPAVPESRGLSPEQEEASEAGNRVSVVGPSSLDYDREARPEGIPLVGAKYALINIRNGTGSVISFEFKWGTSPWQSRSIDPGLSRNFWWTYPAGSTASPTFYVRRGSTTYALRRYAADEVDPRQAAKYEFSSPAVLRATDGEVFPGDWTRVAWFRYGNWSNGMYVNGVRVERFMGPELGYRWHYRVQIVDVSLSSGLPCVPGQHWEGLVRAKVSGPGAGYLDTGDMAVHSGGGTKTQTWQGVDPGDLSTCTLWRQTWCEW